MDYEEMCAYLAREIAVCGSLRLEPPNLEGSKDLYKKALVDAFGHLAASNMTVEIDEEKKCLVVSMPQWIAALL